MVVAIDVLVVTYVVIVGVVSLVGAMFEVMYDQWSNMLIVVKCVMDISILT